MDETTKEPWCLRYFTYAHLPEGPLRDCSKRFADEAHAVDDSDFGNEELFMDLYAEMRSLPDNHEAKVARAKICKAALQFVEGYPEDGMRTLLEAKDCAVRSLLEVSNE